MSFSVFTRVGHPHQPAQFPPPASCSTRPSHLPTPHTNCTTAPSIRESYLTGSRIWVFFGVLFRDIPLCVLKWYTTAHTTRGLYSRHCLFHYFIELKRVLLFRFTNLVYEIRHWRRPPIFRAIPSHYILYNITYVGRPFNSVHPVRVFAENQPSRHLRDGIFCLLFVAADKK